MFLDSHCSVGTLLLERLFGKFFGTEILAKHRRHAAFEGQRGEAKIMGCSWIRAVLSELCFWKVCSENFLARKFLRSMGATQRLNGNAGKQKSWDVPGFAAFCRNFASGTFVRKFFWHGNFLKGNAGKQKSWDVPGFVALAGRKARKR